VESVFGQGFELDEDVVLQVLSKSARGACLRTCGGFGIYSDRIVQLLENRAHWADLGYEVLTGDFKEGKDVGHRKACKEFSKFNLEAEFN
jgi:superfamily I DNA and RNA helicase